MLVQEKWWSGGPSGEVDTEHLRDFALTPISGRKNVRHRIHDRRTQREGHDHPLPRFVMDKMGEQFEVIAMVGQCHRVEEPTGFLMFGTPAAPQLLIAAQRFHWLAVCHGTHPLSASMNARGSGGHPGT